MICCTSKISSKCSQTLEALKSQLELRSSRSNKPLASASTNSWKLEISRFHASGGSQQSAIAAHGMCQFHFNLIRSLVSLAMLFLRRIKLGSQLQLIRTCFFHFVPNPKRNVTVYSIVHSKAHTTHTGCRGAALRVFRRSRFSQ